MFITSKTTTIQQRLDTFCNNSNEKKWTWLKSEPDQSIQFNPWFIIQRWKKCIHAVILNDPDFTEYQWY